MGRGCIRVATLAAAAVALRGSLVAQAPPAPVPFTVHEWGTFTSVAGEDGRAVMWLPQNGPSELPCFVERTAVTFKGSMPGTVRMETPVLYFYAPRPIEVAVKVWFPHGLLTEWYPHADVTSTMPTLQAASGSIAWPHVQVVPGATDTWPRESGANHYYAARETAADPVRVGSQAEKFLFYRGVGQFQPPLTAIAQPDGGVALHSVHGAPLGDVILFENRRGAMTFAALYAAATDVTIARPALDDASGPPLAELTRILVANGLYEAEAQAMVDTWKDSWFEEGARLLYIVPRRAADAILPLTIAPMPSEVARVFVGRIELVTPATLRDVSAAIATNDRAVLARYGRFLQPIAQRARLDANVPALLAPVSQPACR